MNSKEYNYPLTWQNCQSGHNAPIKQLIIPESTWLIRCRW